MRALLLAVGVGFCAMLGVLFGIAVLGEWASSQNGSSCPGAPSADGQPPLVQYYIVAAARYGLGPDGYAYLAAINHVETGFGTNLAVSGAGAVGWMQFEPATFATYGVSITDPTAPPDPDDPEDAIYTAARYLAASGAPGDWGGAIFAYNHSAAYVAEVQTYALSYEGANGLDRLSVDIAAYWHEQNPQLPAAATSAGTQAVSLSSGTVSADSTGATADDCEGAENLDVTPVPARETVIMPNGLARPAASAPRSVQAMVAAGDRLIDERYSYGGGHCTAAMDQQSPDPGACAGEQENGGPGYDCSSSSEYVLWGAGLGGLFGDDPGGTSSTTMMAEGQAGAGRWVTWMASAGHEYIDVDGAVLNTENGAYFRAAPQPPAAPSATGPRWLALDANADNALTRAGFVARHPAGL